MQFRNILLSAAAVLFCAASLSASALQHSWVSGSGIDSNPCTFASPCATFVGALAKTTAGGIITAKDAGDFGSVTISKSITIDGSNLGSITFNSVPGYGIEIGGGANVTLQNLTINGLGSGGYGIEVTNGGIVTVDNCKIMNFQTNGIYFSGSGNLTVENSRIESFIGSGVNGIQVEGTAVENVVIKSTVIDASPLANNNSGLIVEGAGPDNVSLQNVTIMGAGLGAVDTYAGTTSILGSVLTQSSYGIHAFNYSVISIAYSLITANTTGICPANSSKIRVDNNDIYDNPTAIGNCGGIVKTSTTNKTSGTISIPAADVSDSVTF